MALTKVTYGLLSADTSAIDLNIDANTLYVDSSANRVGIGTSSPGVHLDIESSTNNAQIEITATDGTDQSYGIFGATGNNSNGAGFYIQDKTASGSPIRLKIDASGNVGIGTTSPDEKLEIVGGTTAKFYAFNAVNNLTPSDSVFISAPRSANLGLFTASTERVTVDGSGNVGIGTTSPSSAKLVVSGAKTQSGGAPIGNILIADSTALAANVGGGITFQGVYHTGGNLTGLSSIEAMKENATHNQYGGALVFKTREDQGAMNEVARFTSTKNLKFTGQSSTFESPGFTYHTNNYLYLRGGSSGLILSDDSGINTVQIIDGSSGYINFETADGSSRMRIHANGRIGIGTTAAPQAQLDVQKTLFVGQGLTYNASSESAIEMGATNDTSVDNNQAYKFKFNVGGSASGGQNLEIATYKRTQGLGEIIRIMGSTGNVGIGNTNPTAKLEVGDGSSTYVKLRNASTGDISSGYNIESGSTTTTSLYGNASEGWTTLLSGGSLHFRVNNAVSGFNPLNITTSGNIGIGTASPQQNLQIDDASTPKIRFQRTGSYWWEIGHTSSDFQFESQTGGVIMHMNYDGNVGIGTTSPASELQIGDFTDSTETLTFATSQNGTGRLNFYDNNSTEGLYLRTVGQAYGGKLFFGARWDDDEDKGYLKVLQTSAGGATDVQLCLGTTSPANTISPLFVQLDSSAVNQGAAIFSNPNSSASRVVTVNIGANANLIVFDKAFASVGSISTNGSSIAYNTSSDYRLKQNEIAVWDGTTILKQLIPYKFNWKADPTGKAVQGFFAHEVAEVVPAAVHGEKDGEEMQGIDHSKLVPLLVKTIQELEARITELESK